MLYDEGATPSKIETMRTILAQPISAEAFAPFGTVIDLAVARRDYIDELPNPRPAAKARLGVTTLDPIALPVTVTEMERHPFSSQAFVPRDVSRYLVLAAPPNPVAGPDLDALKAFIVPGTLGIIYGVDVWHHPMRVLDRTGSFAVVTFVDGSRDDEEFRPVRESFRVAESR